MPLTTIRPERATIERTRTRPVRVVFCTDNLDIGGTELNAVRTAERLDPQRFKLSVVAFRADGVLRERYERAGIPVAALPMPNLYGTTAMAQGMKLAAQLRREQVDIVHCHDIYANIFGSLWATAARAPAVLVSRRWWHSARPRKLTVANRLAYRLADRVLVNSQAVRRSVESDEGVPANKITVVPNFVEAAAFDVPSDVARLKADLGAGESAGPVIGIIARLAPVKDHATLLHAVRHLLGEWPALRVIIVGDGPERARLGRLAADLGIDPAVRFAGERPNRPNLHHAFDVSVLCSLSEGFPNSVIEAMAAARPVVATAVGGTPDAVVDAQSGLLVPAGDPRALAGALARLLRDPDLRTRLGAEARRRALADYGEFAVLARLEKLYDNLVDR